MKPSVGRIVHYYSYGTPGGEFGQECRAATVTEVGDDNTVGLCVQNPTGLFFHPLSAGGCRYAEVDAYSRDTGVVNYGGTWHWPERV